MSGRILIADDVATNRIVLKAKLSAACYEVIQAENGETALRMARRERPDVILLDVFMPGLDGLSTCERLKADPATRHIPVVMLTAQADDSARMRGLEAGADDFLTRPFNDQSLLARMRTLLREKTMIDELRLRARTCRNLGLAEPAAANIAPPAPALIQIVANATTPDTTMYRQLAALIPDRIEVVDRKRALSSGDGAPGPDLVLICMDAARRGMALDLLAELRSRRGTRHSAFMMILPDGDAKTAAAVLDMGANDYVFASAGVHELAVRLNGQIRRKRYSDQLRASVQDGLRLAVTDPLTGLHNRRYAQNHLEQVAARSAESGQSFAVLLLDVDRFKAINDTHGHDSGDRVLAEIGARLRDNLRGADLVARYGGEEFLAVLPDSNLGRARIAAERMRRIIADTPFRLPVGEVSVKVTLSVGVALCDAGARSPEELIREADKALYASKAEGRNQVSFARPAA